MNNQLSMRALTGAVAAGVMALCSVTTAEAAGPQRTTATFTDWLVQCRTFEEPGIAPEDKANAAKKDAAKSAAAVPGKEQTICEMVQTFSFRRSGRQLAKLAIGKLPEKPEIKAVVQTPLAVYLPDGVVIKSGEPGKEIEYKGNFVRCTATSCFAEIDLKKEDVDKIEAGKVATLVFSNSARTKLSLNVSLSGYGEAFKAAMAQAK